MRIASTFEEYQRFRAKLLKAKNEMRKFFRARYKGMRTEGHSKGPWDLDRDGQGSFYHSSAKGLCLEVGPNAGMRKCANDDMWHANALIMEASPVLFSELKNLVKKIESQSVEDADIVAAKKALELARFDCEVKLYLK